MRAIEETLNKPLPIWIAEVKRDAKRRITSLALAAACRSGDKAVMRGLIVGLWPFIDQFPITLVRAASRLPRDRLAKDRRLLNTLLRHGTNVLAGIRNDESNHRQLWLETGTCLGLSYPADYDRPMLPETQAWIDVIVSEPSLFKLFVRFAAIEIIAEAISEALLSSQTFASILGDRGTEWFRVHADHGEGVSHEELEFRLAFEFLEGAPDRGQTSTTISEVVERFIVAAEASASVGK